MSKPPVKVAAAIAATQAKLTSLIVQLSEISCQMDATSHHLLDRERSELDTTHQELNNAGMKVEAAIKHLGAAIGGYISERIYYAAIDADIAKNAGETEQEAGAL